MFSTCSHLQSWKTLKFESFYLLKRSWASVQQEYTSGGQYRKFGNCRWSLKIGYNVVAQNKCFFKIKITLQAEISHIATKNETSFVPNWETSAHRANKFFLLNTVQRLFDFKQVDWFVGQRLPAHILVLDCIWKTSGNSIYFQINICRWKIICCCI